MLLLSSLLSCRLVCPESERFLRVLRVKQRRSSSALLLKWRWMVKTCQRQLLTRPCWRPSCSVLLLPELLQEELAVCEVPEWFPGIFQVWVVFPLDKVSLTFSLQDLFGLEFLFFLWLVMKYFLQGCALVS